jgi:hypothetical protein
MYFRINGIESTPKMEPKRIGILLGRVPQLNTSALRFLVLQMNTLQKSFEYEFLPTAPEFQCKYLPGEYEFLPTTPQDDFCLMLSTNSLVDKEVIRATAPMFLETYRRHLQALIDEYQLRESLPDYFVLITMARFSDEYYSMRVPGLSILAFGNWERSMAPPSILEFILTAILRESIAVVSPSLRGSIHLSTKGCLLDFTPSLDEAKFKVLGGFICSHCSKALETEGLNGVQQDLSKLLSKDWLGKSDDPQAPAGIISNLGFDLFLTKGLRPSFRERLSGAIEQEGVKELLKFISALLVAAALFWLGLKGK